MIGSGSHLRRNTIIGVLIVAIMLATPGTVLFRSFGKNEVEVPETQSKQPMLIQQDFQCLSAIEGTLIMVEPKNNVFYTWEKRLNDSITINVRVANITGLFGLTFKMYFNSSLLRCTDFSENLFHTVTPESSWDNIRLVLKKIDNANGYIEYAYTYLDGNRSLSEGYAPINITAPDYPEGKSAVATLTFSIAKMPRANGYVDCSLHLASVQPTDIDVVVIQIDLIDGYYKLIGPNGDLNDDRIVDISDAISFAGAFGSVPSNSNWNAKADMNSDDVIDIFDALILATNFGKPAVEL
jgi:hypothetical protein